MTPEMKNRLLEVKWHKVRAQRPCPWLQDHLSMNQRAPKAQEKPAPSQYDNEKSNRPKDSGCLPSHPARPHDQKAHKVMRHHPLNTNTHILKTDLPSNTQKKHTCEPRTTASQSPSELVVFHLERILAFLPLEFLTQRSTQELQNSGQSAGKLPPPHWRAGSTHRWRCRPGLLSGWPWLLVSTQHCLLSALQGKASDPGEETAFVLFPF